MNWKSTWIWLTAAVVLFAFIWLVERPGRRERMRQSSRVILPNFDATSVNGIEVAPGGADAIRAERLPGASETWHLTRPISYAAQAKPIQALLDGLRTIEWQERIGAHELQTQPDAQERYGFTRPQFEISLNTSGAEQKILFGTSTPLGDQVCLQVVGSPDVYLVDAQFLLLLPSDKDQWRDPSLLDPARLTYDSIQLRSPGRGTVELDRNSTNHLWFMKLPVTGRADNAVVNDMLKQLRGLRVQQFVSDDPQADLEPYGLQTSPQTPQLDLTFWRGTNVIAGLQAGTSPTNQVTLVYARRLDPSNIVAVARQALLPWQGAYSNFLDYHFISMSPATIAAIDVDGDGPFTVEKQGNGRWLVHSAAAAPFPPDAILMHDWLASFTNIHTQIEKTVATDLAAYGLTNPVLRYTLRAEDITGGQSNTIMARIEFGTNKEGGIFERRPDETFVNHISADDFSVLPAAAWQLRDRAIWNFSTNDVVSLTVHQNGQVRKYLRDPDGGWTFAPGVQVWPLPNWLRLEEGMFRLGQLRAVYWSGVGETRWRELGFPAADFNLSIELNRAGRKETNSIAFGGRSPYSYHYASVVRDGQPLIFEFPADLYDNFVERDMTIPAKANRHP